MFYSLQSEGLGECAGLVLLGVLAAEGDGDRGELNTTLQRTQRDDIPTIAITKNTMTPTFGQITK